KGSLLVLRCHDYRSRPNPSLAHDAGSSEGRDPVHPPEFLRDLRRMAEEYEIRLAGEQLRVDVFGRFHWERPGKHSFVVQPRQGAALGSLEFSVGDDEDPTPTLREPVLRGVHDP